MAVKSAHVEGRIYQLCTSEKKDMFDYRCILCRLHSSQCFIFDGEACRDRECHMWDICTLLTANCSKAEKRMMSLISTIKQMPCIMN